GYYLSRLNHAACTLPVYASQGGSLRHHATLGSGWWPTSTGRGWVPAGLRRKVSEIAITSLSPFPGLPGALGATTGGVDETPTPHSRTRAGPTASCRRIRRSSPSDAAHQVI